ncbi:MFS transporter [Robbsia sp. Bb-Pol-6]|uniref:MFS transporter n=1 Tax=Robbsia betulipollinis TaxID=2981849 RepID=A0ABT3ZJJ3_9BURK|nr:MFS transporter [Robbsia betulipollinis]MCY0386713.1 MFS transporter [Robbsia betulipollinis]
MDETGTRQETRTIRRITFKLVPFLVLLYLAAYIDRSTLGFAKLQMNADIGIGDAAYGFGAGLFFIAYFLFEVPSNVFLVRIGASRWFARILVTWGTITVAMALIRGPASFYLLRFLLGAAEAGFYPGVVYFLCQWFPARHRASIFGLFLLSQPLALIVTGPLSGGLLGMEGIAGLHGWQWLFILTGLPAMLLAWPTLRLLPDRPRDAHWLPAADRVWLDAELARERREKGPVLDAAGAQAHPLRALGDARIVLLALYFLPYPLAVYGMSMWLPTIIKAFGVSNLTTGFLSAIPYFFAIAGLLTVPRSSDRRDERMWHIAGSAALGAIGLAVSATAHSHVVQLAALCLTAFGLYAAQPIFWTLPSRFLSGTSAAAGIAMINAIGNLGGYLGPFTVGAIKQYTGRLADGLYFLAAGVLLLGVLLTVVVRRYVEAPGGATPAAANENRRV